MKQIAQKNTDNQEDSIIMNKTSVHRGLATSTTLKKYSDTITKNTATGQDDVFMKPDRNKVTGMMDSNYYNKLNDKGYVPEETVITNGDVIIGKVSPIQAGSNTNKLYKDESDIYKSTVPGIVDKVYTGIYNADGYEMYNMRIRSERVPNIGDKFCVTKDHKVLTKYGWVRFDEFYERYLSDFEFRENVMVAQLNDNDMLEFVHPIDVFKFDYKGKMYKLISEHVEFQITPDHILYVKMEDHNDFERIEASKIEGKNVQFKTENNQIANVQCNFKHVDYDDKVYCLQVPSGVFMIEYNGKKHWTGNCSRH